MSIQVLTENVIAQIAAGEVIERPASVVKELLENALDAGASAITIQEEGGGKNLLRVSDNGIGIPAGEIELAFMRHATSKLHDTEDLMRLKTLGFRGEALASIAAVSHVTVTTRQRDEAAGTFLHIVGGNIVQKRAIGAPAGTIMLVENLFFNTPARLKFLKPESTERRHILLMATRYAMAYPHVRFIVEQGGRETFRTPGTGQLADVLVTAFGLDVFRHMIEIEREQYQGITVSGFTTSPEYHRAERSRIHIFINGRWIQDTSITYAVTQAYHTFLDKGRYPAAVVMIELSPQDVDVNVHPTKAEVRFRDPNAVFAAVQRAVRRAILAQDSMPPQRLGEPPATLSMQFSTDQDWHSEPARISRHHTSLPSPVQPDGQQRPRTLPVLRVVGQVGATYIVAEGPAGLYLIDQNAAHTRVLYDAAQNPGESKVLAPYPVDPPHTIDLHSREFKLLEDQLDVLIRVGLQLEVFGPTTLALRSVPSMLSDADPQQIIETVLHALNTKDSSTDSRDAVLKHLSEIAAVKSGTILQAEEMQKMIRQLERCPTPLTSPLGRPTLLHMSSDQISREFTRRG